jgi:ribosome biogenesis GTPase / thiamine phosphate phosphatase
MITFDFEQLRTVGFNQTAANAAAALPGDMTGQLMRLTQVHRETLQLHDGRAEHTARVLPALARALLQDDQALAVGDWVVAAPHSQGGLWVHARLEPASHLVRRDADGRRHAIVSNVDTALIVMGLDSDFNPRKLERFVALAHASGIAAAVVLTKKDICADLPGVLNALEGRLPAAIDLHIVNALEADTAQLLAPHMTAGRTVVLIGSSGAGKSTLTNTLMGSAVQDTGAVRASDHRGMHTTTSRHLLQLPGGACVIDTPGLRTLRPDADGQTLSAAFEDIAALALQCRFHDCRHADEPDCAVRAGVPEDRLRNYHKMLREARRDTLSALERARSWPPGKCDHAQDVRAARPSTEKRRRRFCAFATGIDSVGPMPIMQSRLIRPWINTN